MKQLITLFFAFFAISLLSYAQEFPMAEDADYSTCSGIFTDSQGAAANYNPGETLTTTICSPFTTDRIRISFNDFDLAQGDVLIAYDGDSVNAPLIGAFGSFLAPTNVEASAANSSGCLTFVFQSNPNGAGAPGWTANIVCVDDCQSISSSVTTVPAADVDGITRICQGDTVTITGTPSFSVDGTGATEEIRLPDGTTIQGNTATFTFDDEGAFFYDYIVTDPTGCRDRTLQDVLIQVSTTPDFTGTEPETDIVCFGETVDITGVVETVEFVQEVAPPVSGVTFLPDRVDNSLPPGDYETCIEVNGFGPSSTLTDVNDLLAIFINMEHSYMGDLVVRLRAPNGSEVLIHNRASGGTFLGIPIDVDTDLNPGVGFLYRITEQGTATETWTQNAVGNSTVPAGDYLPLDPFSNLLGTPLNGFWCLNVQDFLEFDNGYIFEWGLEFNPAIIPDVDSYEPDEVSEGWQANPDIINTTTTVDANGAVETTTITVQPSVIGQNCYTFEFLDSFGCTYTEVVCVEQAEEIITATPPDLQVCPVLNNTEINLNAQGQIALDNLTVLDYRLTYYLSQEDAENDDNEITNTSTYPITEDTEIFVKVLNARTGCFNIESFNVDFGGVTASQVPDQELCDVFPFDDTESFDLTENEDDLLGMQDPTEVTVTYYTSLAAAEAGVPGTEIQNPEDYDNVTPNTDEIFIRVEDNAIAGCYATPIISFNLTVTPLDVPTTVAGLQSCDSFPFDGNGSFDLTDNESLILDNRQASNFTFSYYTSETDAIANSNEINPDYEGADGQTIFVLLTDNDGCAELYSFGLTVDPVPVTVSVDGLEQCDTFPFDGQADFDLSENEGVILNGRQATDFTFNYYTSEADALANNGEIAANYPGTDGETIFVLLTDSDGCVEVYSFSLTVDDVPATVTLDAIEECDTFPFDLTTDFDLSVNDDLVLDGRSAADFTIAYFPTRQDALDGTNEISADYEGADMEEIFVLLTETATGCAEVYSFNLITLGAPPIGTAPELVNECEDVTFGNRLIFDLTRQDDAILGGLSSTNFSVGYYNSEVDAFNDVNQLPSSYEASEEGEVVFARLTDRDTGCANVSQFNIVILDCEVVIPEGFTPNGDTFNETFKIQNIEQFDNFSLKVFNRYGTLVYETNAQNYEEFAGIPNSGPGAGDGLLPVGTYFYTMEFNDGETQDIASWLYINY